MQFSAVFFDFDGVVAETLPFHLKAWRDVLEIAWDFQPDEMTIRRNEGKPVFEIARALFQQANHPVSKEVLEEVIRQKNERFREIQQAKIYAGVPPLLRELTARQVPAGLVTGTTRANVHAVCPPEVLSTFSVVIDGNDTNRGKPAPDPYLAAAEKLNILPQACLVIENAPLGIDSARAAGMTCYALTTTLPNQALKSADRVFDSYEQLASNLFQA